MNVQSLSFNQNWCEMFVLKLFGIILTCFYKEIYSFTFFFKGIPRELSVARENERTVPIQMEGLHPILKLENQGLLSINQFL